ncbi:ras-related protein Rab-22A-like [Acanthaster planci]|uniref:Ras-related protein Rab-22A-like n=1 Tax=Acanthaster planci TaxID=133434 RepID=A0A8B7YQ14_ACAPL|nr:ras-related protein Rab-22A-like [Acanthaster planci]
MAMREVKLCLLGDSGVGKSSIVQRFVCDSYQDSIPPTIGASFMSKTVTTGEKSFKFQIWDTAGQEKYRGLAPMYYRGAAAAVVVYDITSQMTFTKVRDWIRELQQHGPENIVIAIAGNKFDMCDLREVETRTAMDYAQDIGAVFIETSAKTAANIKELFIKISEQLPPETVMPYNSTDTVDLRKRRAQAGKKSGCC